MFIKEVYNFVQNGFVFESPKNHMTLQPITYIIPYYAVENVEVFNNYVKVKLKKHLTEFDSFDKKIYRINEENVIELLFKDEDEKAAFLKNVKISTSKKL